MGVGTDWPEHTPDVRITVNISGGALTLGGSSVVNNIGQFPVEGGVDTLVGAIYRNGSKATDLSFSRPGGGVNASSVSVSEGDNIEVRFDYLGEEATPWDTRCVFRRSCFLTVPSGSTAVVFGPTGTAMPTPLWDCAWGWDAIDKFRLAYHISSDDGASQDMTVKTRLLGAGDPQESSSTIDLDTTNPSPHVSAFDKADATGGIEVQLEMMLLSSTSATRVEDRHRIVFHSPPDIDDFPTGFPSSGGMLRQLVGGEAPKLAVL